MNFTNVSVRILVRNDYGACYDFYKDTLGFTPMYMDRNDPYTAFAQDEDSPPMFAIFAGKNTEMFKGYKQPASNTQPDTIALILHSGDFEKDYNRLKEAGVEFLGEPQFIEDWGMRCTYFRDPGGNLIEINDGGV